MTKMITRFAPSPTGYLHVGGARTALFNYLLAKQQGGEFILRVEDTDLERSTDESTQAILEGMAWLGFKPDRGPFFQTDRFDLYQKAIDQLIQQNKAYPCFCTQESLQAKREQAQKDKIKYKYDRTCHKLSKEERQAKIDANDPYCIRFLSTDEGDILIKDLIKGDVKISANELDDLIIRRTDGSPTYNLTVVIDDADMQVTHVIRGDDHLNNTPRQIQLYEALGYSLPLFAHVPMILGSDKKRLSKRHGATSVMAYKEMGYLPHALLNYLVKLGWGHKDQEIFSLDEMIELFSLQGCNSAPSVFNPEKLDWLNAHYIKESNPKDLAPLVAQQLESLGAQNIDLDLLTKAIGLSLEKAKTLKELAQYLDFLFMDVEPDQSLIAKHITDQSKASIARFCQEISQTESLDADQVHSIFEILMAEFDLKMGKIANPIRVALAGKKASPGATDLIVLLGKDQVLKRLTAYQ